MIEALKSLIVRLERCQKMDRDLDADIFATIFDERVKTLILNYKRLRNDTFSLQTHKLAFAHAMEQAPHFTSCINDACTLIPKPFFIHYMSEVGADGLPCTLLGTFNSKQPTRVTGIYGGGGRDVGRWEQLAITVSIAALYAQIEELNV